MAGYSPTPLIRKLGIREHDAMNIYGAPEDYFEWLAPLPHGVQVKGNAKDGFDFIHIFVREKIELEREFAKAKRQLKKSGMLWVSWPKKASKVPTGLDGNIIRDIGLFRGLVDVKVCAINEVWSGLKFVLGYQTGKIRRFSEFRGYQQGHFCMNNRFNPVQSIAFKYYF